MNALTGMEKFSHLEDKIYLTIEFAKKMREEKDKVRDAKRQRYARIGSLYVAKRSGSKKRSRICSPSATRSSLKVEAMLDAMTVIDAEVAEAVGRSDDDKFKEQSRHLRTVHQGRDL